jgi:hypothetical protein
VRRGADMGFLRFAFFKRAQSSGLAVTIKELVAITRPLPGRVVNNADARTGAP